MKKETTNTPTAKRGRPVVNGSKRQAVLVMRAAKVAAGGEIKRGRPAGTKKADTVNVAVKAKKVSKTMAVVDFNPELTHESLQVL
jgi:FKBP-type peptidyl-prolyl cis-trans isomerase 2